VLVACDGQEVRVVRRKSEPRRKHAAGRLSGYSHGWQRMRRMNFGTFRDTTRLGWVVPARQRATNPAS
jgi:hypothetical protein